MSHKAKQKQTAVVNPAFDSFCFFTLYSSFVALFPLKRRPAAGGTRSRRGAAPRLLLLLLACSVKTHEKSSVAHIPLLLLLPDPTDLQLCVYIGVYR